MPVVSGDTASRPEVLAKPAVSKLSGLGVRAGPGSEDRGRGRVSPQELGFLKQFGTPVPGKPRSKSFRESKEDRKAEYAADNWGEEDNVCLLHGVGSVDVDLDCWEALRVADVFLPKTGAIFGRESTPRSHRLYKTELKTSEQWTDPLERAGKKAVIVELITRPKMTVFPPSVHPTGEAVEWATRGERAEVEPKKLRRCSALLAASVVIARGYWARESGRHDGALPLAGALKQLDVTLEEAEKVFEAVIKITDDEEAEDRLRALRDTYSEDGPIQGVRELGRRNKKLADWIRQKLGGGHLMMGDFKANDRGVIHREEPENIRKALDKMGVEVVYDVFSRKKFLRQEGRERRLTDDELVDLRLATKEKFGFLPSKDFFHDVIDSTARQNFFHAVRDYLDGLKWDGKPRLDTWLITYAEAKDNDYTRAVGTLTMIAAVRRIKQPGCKFDELLVLESEQGWNKSSALRALCSKSEWFTDSLQLGDSPQKTIEGTCGIWIAEISELVGGKRESERLKAFLSRQVDGPVRMAYGREPEEQERQFICIGTTNQDSYLVDSTGNRRYWPVRVGCFDVDGLTRDRDQIWAEAVDRESKGESARLKEELWPLAGKEQERRLALDPWEEVLTEVFKDRRDVKVQAHELWAYLDVSVGHRTPQHNTRLGAVMRRLGFRRKKIRPGKGAAPTWCYARGSLGRLLNLKALGRGE